MDIQYLAQLLRERLFSFIKQKSEAEGGCWEWTGLYSAKGYGRVFVISRWLYAHNLSWIISRGLIPKGFRVRQQCENPRCIRPDHLFLVAIKEDEPAVKPPVVKVKPQRSIAGSPPSRGRKSKLSEAVKAEIYKKFLDAGEPWGMQQNLAAEYGVTSSMVSSIIRAKKAENANQLAGVGMQRTTTSTAPLTIDMIGGDDDDDDED